MGITLSSSRLSYPHPYRITYSREGPTVKIDEEEWVPILLDTITDTNGSPYIFFVLHRELLQYFTIAFFYNKFIIFLYISIHSTNLKKLTNPLGGSTNK